MAAPIASADYYSEHSVNIYIVQINSIINVPRPISCHVPVFRSHIMPSIGNHTDKILIMKYIQLVMTI